MLLFLKAVSSNKRVSDEESSSQEDKSICYTAADIDGGKSMQTCTSLTVWRKSLLVSCSGFTVIDCKGDLVYRVDNYSGRPGEIVLMDGYGKSILTMRRHKTLGLLDNWLVYEGDADEQNGRSCTRKQPIWYVKKSISILQANSKELAQVYTKMTGKKPWLRYVIEGSYGQRSCKILDKSTNSVVAEIKRKEAMNGSASFGLEVFHLIVWPSIAAEFAMSLVLLLDQMFS